MIKKELPVLHFYKAWLNIGWRTQQ